MQSMSFVREGFRIAGRHKRLVVVLWLVPLIPALVLGAMAASNLAPALGQSLFADRALDGDWFVVLMEFRSSPADALRPIVGLGAVVMLMLTLMLQVALSAGVVEVLLERDDRRSFMLGVGKNFLRFFRTTILLVVATAALLFAGHFLIRGFFKVAEAQADGRFDLLGIGFAIVLFFILWAPLDLAADLSRISAARHDDRSMLRGFIRALGAVVRRPGLFVPMYLIFLLLPLLLHFVYYQLRSPWTPATAGAILALLAVQQTVMLIRAFFKLGFWGAEISAYRGLDEPEFCRSKAKTRPVDEPIAETPEILEVDEIDEIDEVLEAH
jgi:hypothetical protein